MNNGKKCLIDALQSMDLDYNLNVSMDQLEFNNITIDIIARLYDLCVLKIERPKFKV